MSPRLHFVDMPTVRAQIAALSVLWFTTDHIDPMLTAVVTFRSTLEEAVSRYAFSLSGSMPCFLLADADAEKEEDCAALGRALGVTALPLALRHRLPQTQLCLFARPLRDIWDKEGLETLAALCARQGIKEGYQLDRVTMAPLPRRCPSPEHIERRMEDVLTIYNALADEASRHVFLRFVKSLATGDAGYLPYSSYLQYQHPAACATLGDVLVDGGAFDGGSAMNFSRQVGPHGHVIAFEPVAESQKVASSLTAGLPNVTLEPYALWSSSGIFCMENQGSSSCLVESSANADEHCQAISVDDYFTQHPSRCDCIKLDVEGSEPEVLRGAYKTIMTHRPKLHICLYHKQSHYFDIPLYLIRSHPFYSLYMGHHSHSAWESCLYAVAKPTPDALPRASSAY